MKPLRRFVAASLSSCLLAVVVAGCEGGSKPSVATDTTTEATVKGKVTLKGQPAKGGTVTFDPSNYQRKGVDPRTATISPEGTYEIKTLVGLNTIKLGGDSVKKVPTAQFKSFSYDVKAGDNTYDIVVDDAATTK